MLGKEKIGFVGGAAFIFITRYPFFWNYFFFSFSRVLHISVFFFFFFFLFL